ncbi:MAG: acyltransferase [Acidimicrobiia bacterium]|nr:acyltransferase [Acidimicrobiia bacterium]
MDALLADTRRLYERLRSEVREKWHRDLPVDELLFDRWERAESLGFGEGSSIYQSSYVYGDVRVGSSTWIGPFTLLDGTGGLSIGSHCNISAGTQIYTHDTVDAAVSAGELPTTHGRVSIGDRCYLGPNVVVQQGVTIGDGSVIGACSFVNEDIPPGVVAFGVPCRPRRPVG